MPSPVPSTVPYPSRPGPGTRRRLARGQDRLSGFRVRTVGSAVKGSGSGFARQGQPPGTGQGGPDQTTPGPVCTVCLLTTVAVLILIHHLWSLSDCRPVQGQAPARSGLAGQPGQGQHRVRVRNRVRIAARLCRQDQPPGLPPSSSSGIAVLLMPFAVPCCCWLPSVCLTVYCRTRAPVTRLLLFVCCWYPPARRPVVGARLRQGQGRRPGLRSVQAFCFAAALPGFCADLPHLFICCRLLPICCICRPVPVVVLLCLVFVFVCFAVLCVGPVP